MQVQVPGELLLTNIIIIIIISQCPRLRNMRMAVRLYALRTRVFCMHLIHTPRFRVAFIEA